jgi:uncharacterized membrane protein YfcA
VDLPQALILVAAGLACGFQNVLAGGGSTWTLPALEWVLGSPGGANATNRIAILLQNVVAVIGFHRGGMLPWRLALRLSVPALVGGIGGAWLASRLDPGPMRTALACGVAFVAITSMVRAPKAPRLKGPIRDLAFLLVGVYMGFLQIGVGFALIACLVGGLGLDPVRANGAKVLIVLIVTIPVLAVFGLAGQLVLLPGAVVALGNMAGAWIGTQISIRKGAPWIRVVVVLAALAAITKLLVFHSGPR